MLKQKWAFIYYIGLKIIFILTMFGSSLPPVVCRVTRVLFTLFLCEAVYNTYCIVFLFCLSSSCVPYVASFSGLFLFWLPLRYSLTFIASFSGLFLFWLPFRYSLTFIIFKKKVLEIGLCLVFIVMVRIC